MSKPNNNCAPDKLVAATGGLRPHRTRTDAGITGSETYFGPELTKRMQQAFVEAGGNVQYRMLPPFGSDGRFIIDQRVGLPITAV